MLVKSRYRVISSPEAAARVAMALADAIPPEDREKEHFWCLSMNTKNRIVAIDLVSIGGLNSTLVGAREVYRQAVIHAASSIICVHNHPSGDCEPSAEDRSTTARLKSSGDILGITLHDHIVIGDGCWQSAMHAGVGLE